MKQAFPEAMEGREGGRSRGGGSARGNKESRGARARFLAPPTPSLPHLPLLAGAVATRAARHTGSLSAHLSGPPLDFTSYVSQDSYNCLTK